MDVCDLILKRTSCSAYTGQPVADAEIPPNPDYDFSPDSWSDSYKIRRKACGHAIYQSLGVALDDLEGKKKHKWRDYNFFYAPIGLIVFIDQGMPKGSWLDVVLFIQNCLIVDIVCGIALGYRDLKHPLNSYRTERDSLDNFTQWYE